MDEIIGNVVTHSDLCVVRHNRRLWRIKKVPEPLIHLRKEQGR